MGSIISVIATFKNVIIYNQNSKFIFLSIIINKLVGTKNWRSTGTLLTIIHQH